MSSETPLPLNEACRSLASIQEILNITPHPNANKIELATILGWQVVVGKGEFKVGKKVVYLEIDSLCPSDEPWAAMLAQYNYRVKTVKLRGELSQGLAQKLSILPGYDVATELATGTDVTSVLGITKYVAPGESSGVSDTVGSFPSEWISKTDEPRIQSLPELLNELRGHPYYASVKYDGCSATYFIHLESQEFVVCSRNQRIYLPAEISMEEAITAVKNKNANLKIIPKFWQAALRLDLPNKLRSHHSEFAIQAELVGPGVQGNRLGLPALTLGVFNVSKIRERQYLNFADMKKTVEDLRLEMCEIAYQGSCFEEQSITKLLEMAKGKYKNTKNHREGLVFRPQQEMRVRGSRLSFKVINNDFLLKEK